MSRKNKLNELSEIQLSNNDAGIKKHKSVNYTKENENTLTFDDTSCTRIDPLVFPIKEEMDTDISEDLQSTGASRIEGSTTNNDNSEKSKDNVIYFVEPKEEVGIRDEYVDIVSDIEIKKEAIDDPMDSEEPYSTDFLSVDFKEALSSNEAHYEDHNSSIINQQDTSINTDAENGQSNIAEECSNLQTTSSKKKSRSGAGNTPIESQSKNKKMPIMATKEMKNRNVLTLYEKRQVLLGLDSGLNYKDLMKKFKLSRSAVYEIKKKREKIMAATSQSKKGKMNLQKIESRARIVEMKEAGLSIRQIARRQKISPTTVLKWLKRWEESGDLKDLQRPGPKRVTSMDDDKDIIELVNKYPFTNSATIKSKLNIEVCNQTIRRRLGEHGIKLKHPRYKI